MGSFERGIFYTSSLPKIKLKGRKKKNAKAEK